MPPYSASSCRAPARVALGVEEVRVDLQRDRRVRVAELAGDEDRVVPLGDEDAREGVAQDVERHALRPARSAAFSSPRRGEVPVPGRLARRGAEDEVAVGRERRREPQLAQLTAQLRHEDHVAACRGRLQRTALAVAAHLPAHADRSAAEVDVAHVRPSSSESRRPENSPQAIATR